MSALGLPLVGGLPRLQPNWRDGRRKLQVPTKKRERERRVTGDNVTTSFANLLVLYTVTYVYYVIIYITLYIYIVTPCQILFRIPQNHQRSEARPGTTAPSHRRSRYRSQTVGLLGNSDHSVPARLMHVCFPLTKLWLCAFLGVLLTRSGPQILQIDESSKSWAYFFGLYIRSALLHKLCR